MHPGNKNAVHELLVERDNRILPPLRIVLELMKNVKPMDEDSKAFKYLRERFPAVGEVLYLCYFIESFALNHTYRSSRYV